ncbi:hypothetical protein GCM10011491_45790 [Brucella endophytica]|uniref:Uncharacterized protein n=1 Tax=Brucella endophytica TaxID=1963359 RepID=A0A916STH9_9HYPH|nr:hypothetical protein [Brucella endophytica]GGB12849.1 hypothetical protein GCM10011491_45790 [Brucella endophytica]
MNTCISAISTRKFPLRITCLGEARLEDNPLYGSSTVLDTVELGHCGSLDEAIACVERIAGQDYIDTGDDEVTDFEPLLFVIVDREECQVLAGEAVRRGVRWCEPVASDDEVRLVTEKMGQLRDEAFFEASWDNYNTAHKLRLRASVLEGRLIHPDWREAARAVLLKTT